MRVLISLFAFFVLLPEAVFSQQETARGAALAAAFGTPENQWVFNHICVPLKALPGPGYTNRDFVDAYFKVSESRWNAALAAKADGDEATSIAQLAKILHGIIDSYWPDRVQRNAAGAIVAFTDCERLGNLRGVLREEKSGGPDSETQQSLIKLLAEVMRRWKDSRPFDEAATILRSGPMRIAEESADLPLVNTP